jgi:hypothetical protein
MLSATSGDLVGVLEQADKQPAIRRSIMERKSFCGLILLFPSPNTILSAERHEQNAKKRNANSRP